jgi:oligo-alginate lyase
MEVHPVFIHPLYSPQYFKRVLEKCSNTAWGKEALEKLIQQAEERLQHPIDIPLLEGGWSHDYNCPKEGARLVRLSRYQHRCPSCGSVWSGSPWDSVAVSQDHNYYSTGARSMAVLFGITGDARAADWAKHVLLFYATHYDEYALHDRFGGSGESSGKVMCQTLSEASWLIPLAQAHYIMKQFEIWSEEECQLVERKLFMAAAEVIDQNPKGISNWQSYHNAAKAWVAVATNQPNKLDEIIHDPENGFLFQMENSLSDDGFWYEGAWGYHFYTMVAQVLLVQAAQCMDKPLYRNERFQSMFRAPLQCMLPDGTLPPVHDSEIVQVGRHAPLFEFSHRFFGIGDKVLAASARDSLEAILFGEDELDTSDIELKYDDPFVAMHKAGMIFARHQATSQVAMVDYGIHGGPHGHRDKLSLLYYAGGHSWLSDTGMLPYGNPMHQAFFMQTVAHNTIAIGGRSQLEAEGLVVRAEQTSEGWLVLETMTEQAYPGTVLRRTCVLTDRVLVDAFDISTESEQDIDWIVQTKGLPISQPGSETIVDGPSPLGSLDGYEFLERLTQWHPEPGLSWLRAWKWDDAEHSEDRFEMYGLAPSEREPEDIWLAEAPAMPQIGKHSTIIRRRRGVKKTRYMTVLRACREGEGKLAVEGGPSSVKITFPDGHVQLICLDA